MPNDYFQLAADWARHQRDIALFDPGALQCAHYCRTARHLLMTHQAGDEAVCDTIERALERGALQCSECNWTLGE